MKDTVTGIVWLHTQPTRECPDRAGPSVSAMRVAVLVAVSFGLLAAARAQDDDALAIARDIRDRVAGFRTYRAEHPHGVWLERPEARWSVRPTDACHGALASSEVPFEAFRPASDLPIPAAVRLGTVVGGVAFRKLRPHRPVIVACELAARLPAIAALLGRHGVTEVRVLSAWRRAPRESFHTMGLALDVRALVRRDGSVLDVARDYEVRADGPTCEGEAPSDEHAAALRAVVCELAESGLVSTVLTPAYSAGHRDHLHLDIRPDDARTYVR